MREALGLQNFSVTYEVFGGDWRPKRGHRHTLQEEVYFLVSGRAQATSTARWLTLSPGRRCAFRPRPCERFVLPEKRTPCS